MTTLLDHKTTLAYLAHLGYPDTPQTSALLVTPPRKKERKKGKITRNVFLCYVCGAAGSGKTSLLRAFVGKPYLHSYEPTTKMISVVNCWMKGLILPFEMVKAGVHWSPRVSKQI